MSSIPGSGSHVDSISFVVNSNATTITISKNYRASNYNGGQSTLCDNAYGTYTFSSFNGTAQYAKAVGWGGGTTTEYINVGLYGISASGIQGYYSQISSSLSGIYNN